MVREDVEDLALRSEVDLDLVTPAPPAEDDADLALVTLVGHALVDGRDLCR